MTLKVSIIQTVAAVAPITFTDPNTKESNSQSRPLRSSHGRSPSGRWRASRDPPWRRAQPPPGPSGSRPAHSTAWPAPGERGRDTLGERLLFGRMTDICVGNTSCLGNTDFPVHFITLNFVINCIHVYIHVLHNYKELSNLIYIFILLSVI